MLKAIITTMIASMLIAFPVAFYISQTVKGGDGNEYVVSEQLVAADNSIAGGDIIQVSTVVTGDPVSDGNSGGDDNGGSDGNGNGGAGDNSGGDPSSGNGGSSGNPSNSGGASSEGSGGADPTMEGQIPDNPIGSVVINKIFPYVETSTEHGNGEVELYNTGKAPVNVNKWYLRNITGYVIGTIDNKEIAPSGFVVVDVTGLTRDYQGITLFDSGDNKIDSVMYTGVRSHKGLSYARIPDGSNIWKWTT